MSRPHGRRGLFIALEGLGGVGKSTVAPLLGARLDAVLMPSIPDGYQQLRRAFTEERHLDTRYLYFLSALCRAAIDIEDVVNHGSVVVVESYFARATAFHRGMGSRLVVGLPESLIRPDVSFHLVCGDEVRRDRLKCRLRDGGIWDRCAEKHRSAILREYRAFSMHHIDVTTGDPPAAVEDIVRHRLDGGCGCVDPEPLAGHPDLLSVVP
jgi:dTMP kinase